MAALALLTLRGRWPALVGAFVALALGAAAAIAATGVLLAAGDRAPAPGRYAAAPVIVAGDPALSFVTGQGEDREIEREPNPVCAPIDPGLAEELAALPGVERAIADRSFPVRSPGGAVPPAVGRPWSAHALGSTGTVTGRLPSADDEVVATAGLPWADPGRVVTLVTPLGPERLRVVGVVEPGPGAPAPDDPAVYFADAGAARRSDAIDAVAVWPASAAQAARDLIAVRGDRAVVLTDQARAQAEADPEGDGLAAAAVLLGLMTMTIGFVATFAIASSFAFATALRRRELGLLRAIGATPRQVRRIIVWEAVLLAAGGSAAGAVMSLAATPALAAWLASLDLLPAGFSVRPSGVGAIVGAACMLTVALLGAWMPARRAARLRPTEALRDAAIDRGVMTPSRWVAGLAFTAAGVAATAAGATTDAAGALVLTLAQAACLIVGLALLAPLLVPRGIALALLVLSRRRWAVPLLVRRDARASVRRTAAVAAPVLVTVALTGSLGTMIGTLDASDRVSAQARLAPGALRVAAPDGAGLSEADVAALTAIAGVDAAPVVEADVRAFGSGGLTPFAAIGLDRSAVPLALRVPVLAGSLDALDGAAVALGELTARALGASPGDRIDAWLPDGTAVPGGLEVVAVVADGFGVTGMYLPRELLGPHAQAGAATAVLILAPTAEDLAAVRDRAASRGLVVGDAAAPRSSSDPTDSSNMNALALVVVLGVAVVYVAIMLASASAVGTSARARELQALRHAGATDAQVLRAVGAQGLASAALGAAMGLAVAAIVVLGLRSGLAALEGPWSVRVPWALLAAMIVALGAVAAAAAMIAAHRARPTRERRGARRPAPPLPSRG